MACPSWHIMIKGGLRPTGQSANKSLYVGVWVKELGADTAIGSEGMQSLLIHLPLNT